MHGLTTCVTALRFIELSSTEQDEPTEFLFAGIGSEVHVFESYSEVPLNVQDVLPAGVRVHGFSEARQNRVLVYGGRIVALVYIEYSGCSIARLALGDRREFDDWVWGTRWLGNAELVAIACGHSKTAICASDDLARSFFVQSEEKELTWSTTLFDSHDRKNLRAVAGSSFGDILAWTVLEYSLLEDVQRRLRDSFPPTSAKLLPVHRLKGHDGPVMRLRVSADSRYMVTASVDRSVRVWQAEKTDHGTSCVGDGCFRAVFVNYGHLARVWDVSFTTGRGLGVVSVGEDRTCRVWSSNTQSSEVAVFYGHAGRNVWSVDVSEHGDYIRVATGGEDGAIKIRSLPLAETDCKGNGRANVSGGTSFASQGLKTNVYSLPGSYPNPRKSGGACNESGRTIVVPYEGCLFVSTDFGRLLAAKYDANAEGVLEEDAISWTELYRDESGHAYTPCALVSCGDLLMAGQTNGNVTVIRLSRNLAECEKTLDVRVFDGRMVMGLFAEKRDSWYDMFVADSGGELSHWHIFASETVTTARNCGTYCMEKTVRTSLVTCVHVVQDAGVVLVGDRGGRVLVYLIRKPDSNTGRSHPSCILRPHKDRVSSIVPLGTGSGAGREIMTAGFDGQLTHVTLTSVNKLVLKSTLRSQEHVDTIATLYNHPPHETMIVGFRAADLVVWDVTRRTELLRVNVGNWRRAHDLRLDVSTLSGVSVTRVTLAYWRSGQLHLARSTCRAALTLGTCGHGGRANSVVWDGDGVVTAGEDTVVCTWKRDSGGWQVEQRLERHISGVQDVAVGGEMCISVGGADEAVLWIRANDKWRDVWGASIGRIVEGGAVTDALQRVMCVAHVGAGLWVFGRSDGSVCLLETTEGADKWGASVSLVARCQGAVICAASDEPFFAVGDSRGSVTLWRSGSPCEKVHVWEAHSGGVNSLALSAHTDGVSVLSGGDDETVAGLTVLNDGSTSSAWRGRAHCAAVTGVSFVGDLGVSVAADQRVVLWERGQATACMVCDIADCADVCARETAEVVEAVVCGVGLQTVSLPRVCPSLCQTVNTGP